ncbi:DUF2188 domain-containing protein [Bacillus licheniformis]|uniref:DUF2188 domain-containing protein n=1 Tax=Bacillus licheniformis TaxID=1402 RepID=UPI00135F5AAA|nr:hypothetical protein CHCC5026_0959 [Bacillus licheniformis]
MFASLIYTGNKSVNKFREVVFHEGLYGITKCRDRRVVFEEDTAPVELYDTRTEAVEKGEEMAKENRPAKLVIYDRQDNKEDERSY